MAETQISGQNITDKSGPPNNAETVRIRVDTNGGGSSFVPQFDDCSNQNNTRKDAGVSRTVLPRIENATPGGTTKDYDPKQSSGGIKLDKMDPEHVEKPPTPNIKTLADLIHVCRDRGFQIFNDKPNIPDSDKLKVLPAYLSNSKVHSSDGVDAKGRGRSGSSRHSRRRSSYRQAESSNRMYSGWTTRSFKSRSDSRLERSSVNSIPSHVPSEYSINTDHSSGHHTVYTNYSSGYRSELDMHSYNGGHKPYSTWSRKLDFPDVEGDIEAEAILQKRMRRKSKRRHREEVASLVDVIKSKQKELAIIESKINTMKDKDQERPAEAGNLEIETHTADVIKTKENENGTNTDTFNDEHNTINENTSTKNGPSADAGESSKDDMIYEPETDFTRDTVNKDTSEHVRPAEEDSNVAGETKDSGGSAEKNDANITDEQKIDKGDETEIQEYVIQDGNTKLVLYKLRTSTSLLLNVKNAEKSVNSKNGHSCNTKNDTSSSAISDNIGSNHGDKCEKMDKTRESSKLHHGRSHSDDLNTEVIEHNTSSETVSCDTENSSPGDSGANSGINNSAECDVRINKNSLPDIGQRNTKQPSSRLECNGPTDNKDKTTNSSTCDRGSSNSSTSQALVTDSNQSKKIKDEWSTNSEVNSAKIDCDEKLNNNNINLKSDNDTGDSGFNMSHNDHGSKLDVPDRRESGSPMQALQGSENNGKNNSDGSTEHKKVVKMTGNNNKDVSKREIEQEKNIDGNNCVNTSENGIENKPSSSGDKSSVPKQPKRSYGNGFLVSADDDERQDNVTRHTTEQTNVTRTDVKDDTKLTDDNREEPIRSISQPQTSNSGRKSKNSVKSFPAVARRILIATKIKQSFEDEKSKQISFVKELGETRNALRELYRKLKNGEDFTEDNTTDTQDLDGTVKSKEISVEEPKETEKRDLNQEKVKEGVGVKDPDTANETNPNIGCIQESEVTPVETVKEEEKTKSNANSSQTTEPPLPQSGENITESNTTMETERKPVGEMEFNDEASSKTSVRTKQKTPDKKVDNQWDPSHPLYEQIKTGFKSNSKIHNTRHVHDALKSYRSGKFDITDVSCDSVYIAEAKRIYPKGFPQTANKDTKHNSKSKNISNMEKDISKHCKPTVRHNSDKFVREQSLYRKKDFQKSVEGINTGTDNKLKVTKRVSKTDYKSVPTKPESSTPRKTATKRFKFKKVSNVVDVDDDKLNRDKASIDQLMQYMTDTSALPEIKNNRQKKNSKIKPILNGDIKKGPTKIPQANFSSYTDDKEDEGIESFDENESELAITRETAKDRLARQASGRSFDSDKRTDDVPMSKAVDIVQSRQKFYNNDDGTIQSSKSLERLRSAHFNHDDED